MRQLRLVVTMLRYRVASLLLPFFLLAPALHQQLQNFRWSYIAGLLALCACYIVATSLNDVFDLEVDRINHPGAKDRPLVTGDATPRQMLLMTMVAYVPGAAAGFLVLRSGAVDSLNIGTSPRLTSATDALFEEWLASVGDGVDGYVTPKVAVAAVVANEAGEILLTQRADSGVWLYPVGWADVGYSPSEVAVKEVYEETGIECEPRRLIMVLDGLRLGFTRIPLYSLVFHCVAIGGELRAHPTRGRLTLAHRTRASLMPGPLTQVRRTPARQTRSGTS